MKLDRPLGETCLFFDVDGSLIDIAPRPDAVVVPAALTKNLERASAALDGALALVSGRSIAQLDTLFGANRFRASGVHGAEMRYEPDGPTMVSESDAIPQAIWDDLTQMLVAYPGTIGENKRFSFAVHFRAVPELADRLHEDLRNLLSRHSDSGLRLMPGHFVFEVKGSTFNKGVAVRRFLAQPRFAGRKPIFIGDDVTDQPGFAAAIDFGGLAYSVGARLPGTTGLFASPSDVRHWVSQIAETERVNA